MPAGRQASSCTVWQDDGPVEQEPSSRLLAAPALPSVPGAFLHHRQHPHPNTHTHEEAAPPSFQQASLTLDSPFYRPLASPLDEEGKAAFLTTDLDPRSPQVGCLRTDKVSQFLVLDPGVPPGVLESCLSSGRGWQRLTKRGVHTFRQNAYQVVGLTCTPNACLASRVPRM